MDNYQIDFDADEYFYDAEDGDELIYKIDSLEMYIKFSFISFLKELVLVSDTQHFPPNTSIGTKIIKSVNGETMTAVVDRYDYKNNVLKKDDEIRLEALSLSELFEMVRQLM